MKNAGFRLEAPGPVKTSMFNVHSKNPSTPRPHAILHGSVDRVRWTLATNSEFFQPQEETFCVNCASQG